MLAARAAAKAEKDLHSRRARAAQRAEARSRNQEEDDDELPPEVVAASVASASREGREKDKGGARSLTPTGRPSRSAAVAGQLKTKSVFAEEKKPDSEVGR